MWHETVAQYKKHPVVVILLLNSNAVTGEICFGKMFVDWCDTFIRERNKCAIQITEFPKKLS